jgi:hypothetical protein
VDGDMSRGKKLLLYVVILFAGGTLIATSFSVDRFIKSKIEETGSEMTKTSVTVDKVSVSPFSGEGSIGGIRVRNPEGFESEYAAVIDRLDISLDLLSVFSDTIRVHEIKVEGPLLSVIQKVPENNLRILLENMEQSLSEEPSESNMIIEQLIISDAKATVTPNVGGEKSSSVSVDSVRFEGLGHDGGSATHQVVYQVADRVVSEVLKAALQGQVDELTNRAKNAIRDLFEGKDEE